MIFPSDNINLSMHAYETLIRARRWLIKEGWCKGSMSDNGWCIAGAITAVADDEYGEDVSIRSQNTLAHQLRLLLSPKEYTGLMPEFKEKSDPSNPFCRNSPDIVAYNDRHATEFDDVLRLIDLGIVCLDRKIANPCECDFDTVIVVVDWSKAHAI